MLLYVSPYSNKLSHHWERGTQNAIGDTYSISQILLYKKKIITVLIFSFTINQQIMHNGLYYYYFVFCVCVCVFVKSNFSQIKKQFKKKLEYLKKDNH